MHAYIYIYIYIYMKEHCFVVIVYSKKEKILPYVYLDDL